MALPLASPRAQPTALATGTHAARVFGRTEPRLWTPPLRELTPDTSYGFDVVDWSRDALRFPLLSWQEWLVIHAGELLPDGRPRFREVYVLVARQNGKTTVPVVLSGYWMFVEDVPLILGTSTKLDYAKESWSKVVKLVNKSKDDGIRRLKGPGRWTRDANGEQECWTTDAETGDPLSRYKIAASNAEGGRSLTIYRLILDELRQHHTHDAWNAAEPATSATTLTTWGAQIWGLSNAGDDNSVVLNEKRDEAIEEIDGVEVIRADLDPSIGWFEWSCFRTADPGDPEALAMANPSFNVRIDGEALVRKGRAAQKKGGKALTGFQTEYMCIRVRKLDPAIDPGAWSRCLDPGTLSAARSRVALCLDLAPDELHASLIAAAVLPDDRVRVEAVAAWEGAGCADALRRDLPGWIARIRPQVLGWLPNGPAAGLAADLRVRPGPGRTWPPAGVTVEEIRGEVPAICMGLAKEVTARRLAHSDDPLINAHVGGAERLPRPGGTWVFARSGTGRGDQGERSDGHCDAAYATAGAVHLARTLPAPVGKPRLRVISDDGAVVED